MNLSPIPGKKIVKLDEDFFSIEERDLSVDYEDKKVHSLLDIKDVLEQEQEDEESKSKELLKPISMLSNNMLKIQKDSKDKLLSNNFIEKRRLSRAVETNIVNEMEMDSALNLSGKSNVLNNSNSQKIDSSSSSPNNSNSNNSSSKNKSSYSYSSSSSSISIENQEKVEIDNIIK
jgi:hypothetical protein